MSEIKKDDYYLFLKLFEYNYAYEYSPISFIHMIKEYSDHLKKEILSNFINLNRDEKLAYIDWLKFDIEKLQNNVWSTNEHLEKWYLKYNVPEDFVFNSDYSSNKLYQFLQSDRPTFKETFEPDVDPDLESSMDDFYNYYYGQGINKMLSFIEEQVNKLQPNSHLLSTSQNIDDSSPSNKNQLKEVYLNKFLQYYNDIELPLKSTVMFYNDFWTCFFLNLKSEIQSNIIKLPKEDRIFYLESIFNKIKSRTIDFGYFETDLQKWYEKYKITEHLLFNSTDQNNELYHILCSWPPDFDQVDLPKYNNDTEDIQNDFYNYIMLRNANDVTNFIRLQISILEQPLIQEDKNIEPIQVQSTNSDSGFLPSFEFFLRTADILDKYKSDWSCSSFYEALDDSFNNVQADILRLYVTISQNDKQSFITAYLKKIELITKHYIGGSPGYARRYLTDNNFTLEYVFETLIFNSNVPIGQLPACLRLSYDEFLSYVENTDHIELRASFFHLLSDIYVEKLTSFIEHLSDHSNTVISANTSTIPGKNNNVLSKGVSKDNIYIESVLSFEELIHIYPKLSKYIDTSEANFNNFLHIFGKDIPPVKDFKKINWKGEKVKLFAFIYAVSSYTDKKKAKCVPNQVLNIIPDFFIMNNEKITSFSRPKTNEYKNIKIFTNIVSEIISNLD